MNKSNIQRSKKMSPLLKLIASVFLTAPSLAFAACDYSMICYLKNTTSKAKK